MAFEELQKTTDVVADTDVLGGRTFLVESGLYDVVIDMAYMDKSKGGATSFNITCKGQNGEEIKQTIYVTSKTGSNTYPVKDRKTGQLTGEKAYLPGFNVADAICTLTLGKDLVTVASEAQTKTIAIYDFDLKKETNQEKQVMMDLIGQELTIGVFKNIVDKNKLENGVYVPTGETREENEIGKVFRASDGLTTVEIDAEATSPDFKEAWGKKHTGVTRNKAKGATNTGTAGTPAAAASGTKSLFNKP